MDTLVSIIIRTKNEERWISQCMHGVFSQKHKSMEVIIVDNRSSDKTLEKAGQFNIHKVLTCDDYLPGKALNMGIKAASGEYIAFLSGHCIPVNDSWITNLLSGFEDPAIAGVYGRQEPMSFTPDADKRDLALVFGLDRKVQEKDSFFHNANSMIRRSILREEPFDENVSNIEDRVWARNILKKGYKILYEPEASVYHYHGIHQNGDEARCASVVKVMEGLDTGKKYKSLAAEGLNIVAIIPIRGGTQYLNNKPLLAYTIERAIRSKYIKKVIVSTDSDEVVEIARSFGAETPFIRDPELSGENVDLSRVFKYSLEKIEQLKIFPDLVVCMEITFPFRSDDLIDNMVEQLTQNGFDSIVAAKAENRAIWKEKEGKIIQLNEGLVPRKFKDKLFLELRGVGCVTHPEFLREGSIMGNNIAIYTVDNPFSHIEVRTEQDFQLASLLINAVFK